MKPSNHANKSKQPLFWCCVFSDAGYNPGTVTDAGSVSGSEELNQTSVILIIVFVSCSVAALVLLGFFLLCKTKPVVLY